MQVRNLINYWNHHQIPKIFYGYFSSYLQVLALFFPVLLNDEEFWDAVNIICVQGHHIFMLQIAQHLYVTQFHQIFVGYKVRFVVAVVIVSGGFVDEELDGLINEVTWQLKPAFHRQRRSLQVVYYC